MNWFRRASRACRYVRPANPDWSPDEGQRIEQFYAPQIEAFEIATDRYRGDYSEDQWQRAVAWMTAQSVGLRWQRLFYGRHLIGAGHCSDWPGETGGSR